MQVHPHSEAELTPLQLQDLAIKAEIDTPIMSYKVMGNRVELHLLGGAIAAVEAEWLLTPETAKDILDKLEDMTAEALQKLAADLKIRGRSTMTATDLIAAIRKKQK